MVIQATATPTSTDRAPGSHPIGRPNVAARVPAEKADATKLAMRNANANSSATTRRRPTA